MTQILSKQHLLLLSAPYQLDWVEHSLPVLGPNDLLLQTRCGAISIGTELPLYKGTSRGARPAAYPLMTGYESLAEVIACGSAVEAIQVGERVVAFYGHRTAAVVPATRVVPVPAGIPDRLALLLILACDTAKGVMKVEPRPGEPVLITGAGAIGLLTLFNLLAHGVTEIDIVEPLAGRRAFAMAYGARRVIDPASDIPEPDSYPVGFECSSRERAFQMLQNALCQNGRLCILADGNNEPLTLAPAFHAKELHVIGSSDGLDYRSYAPWYWEALQRIPIGLEQLFEQTVASAELPSAFAELAQAGVPPIKILVHYS